MIKPLLVLGALAFAAIPAIPTSPTTAATPTTATPPATITLPWDDWCDGVPLHWADAPTIPQCQTGYHHDQDCLNTLQSQRLQYIINAVATGCAAYMACDATYDAAVASAAATRDQCYSDATDWFLAELDYCYETWPPGLARDACILNARNTYLALNISCSDNYEAAVSDAWTARAACKSAADAVVMAEKATADSNYQTLSAACCVEDEE